MTDARTYSARFSLAELHNLHYRAQRTGGSRPLGRLLAGRGTAAHLRAAVESGEIERLPFEFYRLPERGHGGGAEGDKGAAA